MNSPFSILAGGHALRAELEFLPAALEIEETPPLPLARLMLWVIVAFFVVALIWAIVGRVDIVGVATGKIVPSGRTKTIQPLENAVVSAIHVAEGQHVEAGEVLIELDPTAPSADKSRLANERLSFELDRARLTASLDTISRAASTLPVDPFAAYADTVDPIRLTKERARLTEQLAEYHAALAGIEEDVREKRAEREAVGARITQLDATLPLITEEAESHKKLMATGMTPRVRWLELERERITQQQERDVQWNTRTSLEAGLESLAQKRAITAAQYRSCWMNELAEAETRLASYDEELAKADRRLALQHLTAPVSGTVQQLAVHTVGGVVTEAQPLMMIVPDDSPIEVEARVANKDIGFVHEGQQAIVKVETFNFTKYGYLDGRVGKVSRDAVIDKELGLYYLAHVALAGTTMKVDGRDIALEPGMAVSVEVKMGRRRVIEFLLSPLLRYQQESGRER